MKLQKMDFGQTLTKLVSTKKGKNQLQKKKVIITLKSPNKKEKITLGMSFFHDLST